MKSTIVLLLAALLPGAAVSATDTRAAAAREPEIEFRVLLVIKRASDTYSPLFLPVRAEMTEAEVAAARRCFEIETPDMVRDITGGRVRFAATVHVSDKPLRLWDPKRLDG
jgi:hypothetical protein